MYGVGIHVLIGKSLKQNQTFWWVVMQVHGGSGITRDKRPRVQVDLVELEIASTATG